jgi:hypothetical protein
MQKVIKNPLTLLRSSNYHCVVVIRLKYVGCCNFLELP